MGAKSKTIKEKVYEDLKWNIEIVLPKDKNGQPIKVVPLQLSEEEEEKRQQYRLVRLYESTPVLLERLKKLVKVVGALDDTVLKEKYEEVLIAWRDADELIEYIET